MRHGDTFKIGNTTWVVTTHPDETPTHIISASVLSDETAMLSEEKRFYLPKLLERIADESTGDDEDG